LVDVVMMGCSRSFEALVDVTRGRGRGAQQEALERDKDEVVALVQRAEAQRRADARRGSCCGGEESVRLVHRAAALLYTLVHISILKRALSLPLSLPPSHSM
jgi:hypothetical protein